MKQTDSANADPAGTLSGVRFPKRRAISVLDHEDRVIVESWCISCGGSLLGCVLTQRCPNCEHPVSDSIHGDFLIYTDRERVIRLAEAARFLKHGCMLLGGLIILGIFGNVLQFNRFEAGVGHAMNVMLAGAIMLPVLAAVGMFTLTSRHSANYYRARYGNKPTMIRLGALVAVIVVAAIGGLSFSLTHAPTRALILASWATIPVLLFLNGLENLLRRVPNLPLANMARLIMILGGLCGAALLTVLLMREYLGDSRRQQEMLVAATLLTMLGGILLTIAGVRMLIHVETVLRKAAR